MILEEFMYVGESPSRAVAFAGESKGGPRVVWEMLLYSAVQTKKGVRAVQCKQKRSSINSKYIEIYNRQMEKHIVIHRII